MTELGFLTANEVKITKKEVLKRTNKSFWNNNVTTWLYSKGIRVSKLIIWISPKPNTTSKCCQKNTGFHRVTNFFLWLYMPGLPALCSRDRFPDVPIEGAGQTHLPAVRSSARYIRRQPAAPDWCFFPDGYAHCWLPFATSRWLMTQRRGPWLRLRHTAVRRSLGRNGIFVPLKHGFFLPPERFLSVTICTPNKEWALACNCLGVLHLSPHNTLVC